MSPLRRFVRQRTVSIITGALVFLAATVSFAQQTEDVSSSLVRIDASTTSTQGSGIVVARQQNDALVLTAYHVIDGAQRFTVTFGSSAGARRFDVMTAS